jgi:hypothetical protein
MKPARHFQHEFMEAANLDRSQVLSVGDRIQRLAQFAPRLTARCQMANPMKVRRLLTLPAQSWHEIEIRWAKELLAEIKRLELENGPEIELALACCGVGREGLDAALEELERQAGQSQIEPDEIPVVVAEPETPPAKRTVNDGKKEKRQVQRKIAGESEPEEDLDPETARMLAEVLAEAAAAKGKAN